MITTLSLVLVLMLSIGGSPAGGPGNTGIQAPIDNSCTINRNFEDYSQKTASRADSKKIPVIHLINQPKTQSRLIFTLPLKEKPLLMGYEDSMNLYQAFNMNPVNFTDPFGLQEKEFQVMCMYPDNKLEDILIMQQAARRGYAKGALALGIGLVAAPLSGPAIIAFVGSTLIYTGLDEYSERIKSGQSPYEAKTGTIVNKMTLGLYPIIKGRDPGTGDAIEAKERVLRGMDWLGQFIAGASGYISGKIFFGLNPSTFQLTDEAFKKTTGQATYNYSGNTKWLDDLKFGNNYNKAHAFDYQYRELYIENPKGGYYRLDAYNPGKAILSRKFTQLGEISEQTAINYINELAKKYPAGAKIANVPSSGPLAGLKLRGQLYLEVPYQNMPIPRAVIDAANAKNILIKDVYGNIYNY